VRRFTVRPFCFGDNCSSEIQIDGDHSARLLILRVSPKKTTRTKPKRATKILLIRHAEKPAKDSTPFGVTAKGERSKESLEVRGWQRAGALANLLAPSNGRLQHSALAKPQFLYASRPVRRRGSRRPVETLMPLAQKLAVRIHSNFQRAEYDSMIEEAVLCKGVVLICWQREYIPEIASHILGSDRIAPPEWPDDCYDMIWVFDLLPSRLRYTFKQVPQKLLDGDLTTPIR
jgi:hypothetical protein